jgi:hypothetical protein
MQHSSFIIRSHLAYSIGGSAIQAERLWVNICFPDRFWILLPLSNYLQGVVLALVPRDDSGKLMAIVEILHRYQYFLARFLDDSYKLIHVGNLSHRAPIL